VAGCWQPGDPKREQHIERVWSAWRGIAPDSIGSYVNVQDTDEGRSRTKGAYHDNLDRLARIKAAYDPEELFRMNRNTTPA
jgi:FAD/FMN-containing dehydrogenase